MSAVSSSGILGRMPKSSELLPKTAIIALLWLLRNPHLRSVNSGFLTATRLILTVLC
jgi:hypothetical protein